MNPQQPSHRLLILAILVVVALQVIWLFLVLYLLDFGAKPLKGNMASRGQFGDLFGGVNALFTGLAFAGLLFTIALQRYDLRIQRDALEEQAKLLQDSTRLSAMATLADIYTRQIDVMERGGSARSFGKRSAKFMTWLERSLAGWVTKKLGMKL